MLLHAGLDAMIRLLFRAVISVVLVVEVAAVSFGGAFGSVGRWLKERGLVSCGFVDNPLAALDDNEDGLRKRIVSQDWAISTILDAFETQRPISNDKTTHRLVPPMFLYFVGPTGVGKTFTAINIAEIIQDTDRDPVLLRGENYNNDATTVDEYHRQIQTVLKHHLKPCKGRNVVIFDEVQKVAPKTLDVFGPILDNGQFEFVTHEGKVIATTCVFCFRRVATWHRNVFSLLYRCTLRVARWKRWTVTGQCESRGVIAVPSLILLTFFFCTCVVVSYSYPILV